MRHCFYHIGDKGTASVEAVRMGLKIIFDIHDQKQDGKIYRINRNKSRIPVEVRMNTKQHIVPHCFYKHVLIAVNSMDEFHDIIRQVFDLGDFSSDDKRTENDDLVSSVFMELSRLSTTSYATRVMKSGILTDVITPETIPYSAHNAALLAVHPASQEYLSKLGEIENIPQFVVLPHNREDEWIQSWIDTNTACEIVMYH